MPQFVIPAVIGAVGSHLAAKSASKDSKRNAAALLAAGQQQPVRTPHSSIGKGADGVQEINIDPKIRELRERALGRLPEYRAGIGAGSQRFQGQLQDLDSELKSNNNQFIQARLNPLRAQVSSSRGELTQGMTNRGLGGSSFAGTTRGNFDAITGRELGDQASLATQEALAARMGVNQQQFAAMQSTLAQFQGLDAQEQAIAAGNLSQELVSLGLSQQDASAAIAAAGLQNQGDQNAQGILGRGLQGIGGALGGIGGASGQPGGGGTSGGTVPSGGGTGPFTPNYGR